MRKYLLIIIVILVTCNYAVWRYANNLRQDRNRLSQNQAVLMSDLDCYRTQNGEYAASVQALTLKCGEFERLRSKDAEQIKALNLKVKRLQSITNTATITEVNVSAPVRDTIIIRDTVPSVAKAFSWADKWTAIAGIVYPDSVHCSVLSVDSLVQVVHRVPRKFLFFRYGCKAIRQEIVSKNPHTRIVYAEYVELGK